MSELVAGGGFEPYLAIDNRQLIDFISGIKSNKDTMSESTVQIQYTRPVMSANGVCNRLIESHNSDTNAQ